MLLVALALFTRAFLEPPAQPGGRHAARQVAAAPAFSPRDAREPMAPAADPTRPRIRPLDDGARVILANGEASSETIDQLINTLEGSDVVVYIQTALGVGTRGRLSFVAYGAPLTYVLVRVDLGQGPRERIATLAHELTHAVEIAQASSPIRAEADLARLYRQIGVPSGKGSDFESAQAVTNEQHARTELRRGAVTRQD